MKKTIRIELDVVVDTDLTSPDDIVNTLNIDVEGADENVEVDKFEVNNFNIIKV